MEILGMVIAIEVTMAFVGFVYALVNGNKDMFWLWRCLMGAAFFALWFVSIPYVLITEHGQ